MRQIPYFKSALVGSLVGHLGAGYLLFETISAQKLVEPGPSVFEVSVVSSSSLSFTRGADQKPELALVRASLQRSKVSQLKLPKDAPIAVIASPSRLQFEKGGPQVLAGAGSGQAVRPTYPEESRIEGEEGQVTFRVRIDVSGQAQSIDLVRSSGFERLDNAARSAISASIFSPSRVGGNPIESEVILTYSFRLLEK